MDLRKAWAAVLGELETSITPAQFKTWFPGTSIISQEDGYIVIGVRSPYAINWLKNKYQPLIVESLNRVLKTSVARIEYKVTTSSARPKDELVSAVVAPGQASVPVLTASPAPAKSVPTNTSGHSPRLNPRYTFESFIVGSSNDLAYAAAQAVVRFPGQKYNPLFIYGGVGLGKTHLMQAIGNEMLRQDPSKRVRYVTSEEFTSEFIDGVQNKRTKNFASLYRNLDVLIVDDIQFLGSKEKTQEEFFHTFNTLHQANKQIIMSSDRPPRAIAKLEDRLLSRFEMGMSADIQRPDFETRSAIVREKAKEVRLNLSNDVADLLARHYQHSIRELEGALTKLSAHCEVRAIDPSITLVEALLAGGGNSTKRKVVTPRFILEKTAAYFDVAADELTGPKRDKDIVVPRQVAMYLMRRELGLSYPKIGQALGGRDHSTAMHSVEKVEKLLELDEDLRAEINGVKERIAA